jgi:glycyl-tRNA synthetase beta chain
MNKKRDLLVEIGTEELPPKALKTLSLAFAHEIEQDLGKNGFGFERTEVFATPRRLAVKVINLDEISQPTLQLGPPVSISFDTNGNPTVVAEKFAEKLGCAISDLKRVGEGKNEKLSYEIPGATAVQLIPSFIETALSRLPIPKLMYWGELTTLPTITQVNNERHFDEHSWYGYEPAKKPGFARPVQWLLLLFGNEALEMTLFGLTSGKHTFGHRFHAPYPLPLSNPDEYPEILKQQGKVTAGFEERMTIIRDAANQAASNVGGIAHIEDDLLEEVAALNEWPVPVVGNFDARFLELPQEVLITTMQSNQKYFPVKNAAGRLLPHFITFANIESSNPDAIRQGNERVVLPRLVDAEFFWKQDRKQSLAERVESLKSIVFQKDLGTLFDKTERVASLAALIAEKLGADVELAKRAALLAKTDLMTNMVGEFANLQGTMGRYYAIADGEQADVALALEEHYYPKQSGGATPSGQIGQVLALAEKIDTLVGIFSAGLIPTGDRDPYALRRATLGILRILIENGIGLDVVELLDAALDQFSHSFNKAETRQKVIGFLFDRLKGYCLEQGYTSHEFDAVLAVGPASPLDFMLRIHAVQSFSALPEAESLAAANKRIINILKKSDQPLADNIGNLVEIAEKSLLAAAEQAEADILPLLAEQNYPLALSRLAQLRDSVDAFFDNVMVNTDDEALRNSRLALLAKLSNQFLKIADISKLQS